jgi:hypothetical protein
LCGRLALERFSILCRRRCLFSRVASLLLLLLVVMTSQLAPQ